MSDPIVTPLPEPILPLSGWYTKHPSSSTTYQVQASLRRFRADIRVRKGRGAQSPEFTAIRLPGGGDLMWSEPVDDQTVLVLWGATGFCVYLVASNGLNVAYTWPAVRAARWRHSAAALMWCIQTAEAAVATLRERRQESGMTPDAEAWLRRQLAGLGPPGGEA